MSNSTLPAQVGSTDKLGPLPEPAAHTLEWHAHGGEDIGWVDFYAKDDKVPSDWDGPPPDEVTALFTESQMHAYALAERERCAQACEQEATYWPERRDFRLCAARIRNGA